MKRSIAALALLFFVRLAAAQSPLAVGERFPEVKLADQHEVEATVGPAVKLVLFSRDMDGAAVIEDALAEGGAAKLTAAGAVVMSDISRMPALVTRLFALPAMRRRGYSMLLDRDGAATARLPYKEDAVTVVRLQDQAIAAIDFAETTDQLNALLAPSPVEKE